MNDPNLQSGWDTALFVLPMLVLLFLSLFKLDAAVSTPRRPVSRQPMSRPRPDPLCGYCDPDGRPWPARVPPAEKILPEIPQSRPTAPCLTSRKTLNR